MTASPSRRPISRAAGGAQWGLMPDQRPGLCLNCNYPLRGLGAVGRCPECGRPFDPADRRTMNMGRPVGRLGRFLMRPIGWPTLILAVLATAALVYATRPPAGAWEPSAVDLRFYLRPRLWRDGGILLTTTDYVYVAGLSAWLLAAPVWWFRTLARLAVAGTRRWPRVQ